MPGKKALLLFLLLSGCIQPAPPNQKNEMPPFPSAGAPAQQVLPALQAPQTNLTPNATSLYQGPPSCGLNQSPRESACNCSLNPAGNQVENSTARSPQENASIMPAFQTGNGNENPFPAQPAGTQNETFPQSNFHYFWSRTCHYCNETSSLLDELEKNYACFKPDRTDIVESWDAFELYKNFADALNLGNESRVVPSIFFNGTVLSSTTVINETLPAIVAAYCNQTGQARQT